jgi:hypothetical protein
MSSFLDENRTKTDTNGAKPPPQHTTHAQGHTRPPKHTQPTWLPTQAARTTEMRTTVEVVHRCHRHHSSTSQRLRLHQEQPEEVLSAMATRSPRRPMPNSRLIANKTGSSDSEYKLRGEDVQDQRRRKSSHQDSPVACHRRHMPPRLQLRLHTKGSQGGRRVEHVGRRACPKRKNLSYVRCILANPALLFILADP